MASSGRAALCAALAHAVLFSAGCGRLGYDPSRRDGALDASITPLDGATRDGGGAETHDTGLTDAAPLDATITDAAPSAHAFDGLEICAESTDCPSGSCWGRWCVASCSTGCGVGFECVNLPSTAFAYCLPRCDRLPAGCPADAPCNGSVCEPTCDTGGVCPGSTLCMIDTCSGD